MAEPKIAYKAAPDVAPDMPRGDTSIRLQVPRVDFSEAIGRGMENLGHGYGTLGNAVRAMGESWSQAGKMLDHTGDEMFRRAIALQEIDNETKTMEATSAYDIQQGQLDANFTSLKGNNAVDQYKKYTDDTNELRTKMRANLPNDATRRAFDSRTLSMMGRSIRTASSHMGVEQKNAYIKSLDSNVSTWQRQVQNSPFDEEVYTKALEGLQESIRKKNDALGNDAKVGAVEFEEQKEKLAAGKLTAQSSERPFDAWHNFQDYSGQMSKPIRDQVEHTIKDNMRLTGARNAGSAVTNDLRSGKPDDSYTIDQRVNDAVKDLPPELQDDPTMRKNIRGFIEDQFKDIIQTRQITRYNNTNEFLRILGEINPKDVDALKADPKGKAIWDSEDEIGKKRMTDIIRLNHDRQMHVDPIESYKAHERLRTMAATNPQAFLEKMQDVEGLFKVMNRQDIVPLRTLYDKMLKSPEANPNVSKAITWLRDSNGSTLVQLGVDALKRGQNDDDFYDFRTGILTALEDYAARNEGKMPSREEFDKKLAPQILKWKPGSWFPWQSEEGPFWKGAHEIPADWEANRRKEIGGETGVLPEDVPQTQIRKDYVQYLFRESVKGRTPK